MWHIPLVARPRWWRMLERHVLRWVVSVRLVAQISDIMLLWLSSFLIWVEIVGLIIHIETSLNLNTLLLSWLICSCIPAFISLRVNICRLGNINWAFKTPTDYIEHIVLLLIISLCRSMADVATYDPLIFRLMLIRFVRPIIALEKRRLALLVDDRVLSFTWLVPCLSERDAW